MIPFSEELFNKEVSITIKSSLNNFTRYIYKIPEEIPIDIFTGSPHTSEL